MIAASSSSRERGNVLFLILIAVALFAALSYAVTSSTRSGNANITEDQIKLGASRVQQYVSLMRTEVQRLMVARGCTVENLDWRNDYWKRYDGTPSVGIHHSPITPKSGCAVFSDHGGPIPASVEFTVLAKAGYADTAPTYVVVAGHVTPMWLNRKDTGSDKNDIGIVINGLDHAACAYLVDPVSKPTNIIEGFTGQPDPNAAEPATWTGTNDVIDEPQNLTGDFFANFNSLATQTGCQVGAVIVAR